jgi:hypothetical protein
VAKGLSPTAVYSAGGDGVLHSSLSVRRETRDADPTCDSPRAGTQYWLLVLAQRFEDAAIEVEVRLHAELAHDLSPGPSHFRRKIWHYLFLR